MDSEKWQPLMSLEFFVLASLLAWQLDFCFYVKTRGWADGFCPPFSGLGPRSRAQHRSCLEEHELPVVKDPSLPPGKLTKLSEANHSVYRQSTIYGRFSPS